MVEKARKIGFLAIGIAGLLILSLLACGCTQQPAGERGEIVSIQVTGSTTVLPIAQVAAEAYMDTHPTADIKVSGGGSSVGVQAIGEGSADIGMASRDLKSTEMEKYPDLVSTVIASDGIAIIVHPENTVETLTMEQIKAIYLGTYTNWKEAGGPDAEIVLIGRDSASGTREFFSEKVMEKEDFAPTQLEKNSNGGVKQTVAQTPGAIGYVGLGYIDETVKAIPVIAEEAAVEPTVGNVISGDYPIARSLIMITNGQPQGLAKDYLDFILGTDGQKIIGEEGFVPLP
ncbi:MAG: phosphate-binding protein [Methanolinea sp. SDB]|nr:MAG: phosphate-binding protein [Methanolinea sp. SDB]